MTPHTAAELDTQLDALLNPVLSQRRTATPLAVSLAALTRTQQDFTLHWIAIISRTNYELAYQFAAHAPAALPLVDANAAQAWIIQAMDSFDREGLHQGSEAFKHYAPFVAQAQGQGQHAVRFEEAAPALTHFICALAGRRMTIDAAPVAYTDTDTLYLPPRVSEGVTRAQNFLIYKIIATLLWAQSRFGTFTIDLQAALANYDNPARALTWLNALETERLQAQIARVLPGLARDLAALHPAAPSKQYAPLREPHATVADSLKLLRTLPLIEDAPRHAWTGVLRPVEATSTRAQRIAREKDALQAALAALLAEQPQDNNSSSDAESSAGFEASSNATDNGDLQIELRLDGNAIALPAPLRTLLDSVAQDLGEIPDDYLTPAPPPVSDDTDDVQTPSDTQALYYPEWDYQRGHYRKNWCALRELDVPPGDATFIHDTLKKYAPQVKQLRRTFEMLRGEDRLLKRLPHGDDIDLDAVIAGYADLRAGRELTDRLFTKRHKTERDLAVMFMVDMSGSTKGWINDAEREALVLLSEALEVLGDRYAIYGFSGVTRKRCEIFRIKRFDEPYSEQVQSRISGVQPQDYTRMGVAIRHLTAQLNNVEARTKLLITLSDGKPDDYSDNYRGDYGIEDTCQALHEAHRAGIKPFCITIDREARDYLPHLYGSVNWTLVDDVSRLPLKVADIYRRLAT